MEYLKKVYLKDNEEEIEILNEEELFEYLQKQGICLETERDKVAIFKIGDCIIDWR